jgi:hypothetical protein
LLQTEQREIGATQVEKISFTLDRILEKKGFNDYKEWLIGHTGISTTSETMIKVVDSTEETELFEGKKKPLSLTLVVNLFCILQKKITSWIASRCLAKAKE